MLRPDGPVAPSGDPPHPVVADADAVVRLSALPPAGGATATGRVVLDIGGEPVTVEMTVPAGPVAVEAVLPIFHGLSSLFATRATARAGSEGRSVSCRAGCGACCRQMVPVSIAEARALARLVEAMPEPRRDHVRRRFEAAVETLDAEGLLDGLDGEPGERHAKGRAYFEAGVACPLLEDEACSIHADRPLACREYLVTSPPELCATLAPGVENLALEARPSLALLQADPREGWLPLVLALDQDTRSPPSPRDRTGAEIIRDVIARLG
ncbi:YkgJ family cysteine cluster protein [Brevundimonas sp.]|uniref:YkgJ family cysteine cluster protein n=1 Tax=Brevundimonas sp. TaxID=1871086 RepID=UPI00272FF6D5|nr:YkgJ family cysteine cluster protein [Brevundimonas sp.]MDP1914243.1 YkgJ family cysteine cluster protein [Brevundimonas sp.]